MHAQLSALKMQLQPHFLFNTLNAIIVLVRQHKERQAEEVLLRFSDLLRCVLDDMGEQEVPLQREIEYLRLYLSIEEVRFQDRLRVEVSIDPSVLDSFVPQMGLQPIVENAIRHGISRNLTAGRIQITARPVGGCVEISVSDDGPGFPAKALHGACGIGLTNTKARLEQLYGAAGRLCCENATAGGAIVTVSIPYRCSSLPTEGENTIAPAVSKMVSAIAE
jgi:LytS/YehU family sensor histidine kinase